MVLLILHAFFSIQEKNYTTVGMEIVVRGSFTSVTLSVTLEDTEGNEKTPKIADGGDLKDIVSKIIKCLLYLEYKALIN